MLQHLIKIVLNKVWIAISLLWCYKEPRVCEREWNRGFISFLTREHAKRNKRVIAYGDKYAGGGGGEGGELDAEGGGGGHWSRMIGEWGSEVCFVFTSWLVVAFVFCKRLARVVCVKTLP